MTESEIMSGRFMLLKNLNSGFGRLILTVDRVQLIKKDACQAEYLLTAKCNTKAISATLTHNLSVDKWYVTDFELDNIAYSVINCTNNYAEIIAVGDVINYNLGEGQEYVPMKVIKHQPKYMRYIVECFGERHNLSTILKRYGTAAVIGITTYDTILQRSKGAV